MLADLITALPCGVHRFAGAVPFCAAMLLPSLIVLRRMFPFGTTPTVFPCAVRYVFPAV